MNKQIRNTDLEKILFFDIETVSRNKKINVDSKEFELYSWSLRDRTTGFIPPANEVTKHYENNAALKPEFNKIVVTSIGYIKGTTLYYKALVGEQRDIIEKFYGIVDQTGYKVCGHNIKGFDLPTLRIKALEENMDLELIPENINDSGKKPWDMDKFMIDTMDILKGTNYNNMSLDAACMIVGIASSKDDISGPYVTKTYYNEGVDKIATYCNRDVIATAELFCALQGKRGFITDYVNKDAPKEEVNLMVHIAKTGALNKEQINLLANSGKDKEHIVTLATSALSYTHEKPSDYEPLQDLKDALYGKVVIVGLEVVETKGNLGATEVKKLIKEHKDKTKEEKANMLDNLKKYLTNIDKISQKRCSSAFELLEKEWN
tara:strand:+ start:1714 stop:2841 length:1128 start_codon:yes stop_codon:yes gene_type:complete